MKMLMYALIISGMILLTQTACTSEPEGKQEPVVNPPVTTVEEPQPPEVEVVPADEPAGDTFEVTQEVYDKTFDEIGALIEQLDGIIARKDYAAWKDNLSRSYIDTYSDGKVLKEKSESPVLQLKGVVLKDIKDYFTYVVVPSRMSLNLEEIEFDDENHVTAWTIFNDNRTKLYQLELINGSWKISIW
ncbi:MAG: hypothetical protein JXA95_16375 [Spirochaetales bacterium]|nr:hypothetical protein [Spirochaetales bacterium]